MKRNQIINLINEMKLQNDEAKDLLSIKLQKEILSRNPNINEVKCLKEDIKHFESMNFGLIQLQDALFKIQKVNL
jgi:hypothetical protein